MIEGEHLDSSSVCELLTSLNKNEFPNEVKLDTVHSALCLFSARNSRKQIERATRTRRSRIKSIIFLGPLLSLLGGNRNRKLVWITVTDLHRFDYIRRPELVFSPTRFPLFSFFPIVVERIFDRPLPSPFFFSHRMPQNWIRSNFEYRLILIFVKTKKRSCKLAYPKIYFPIKKQYEYKI